VIPDDLLTRANARASALGWDVHWVDTADQRKIIATDPSEPEPFNKIELTLGETQSWWSAALELGLIDTVEIDDLFNMLELTRAVAEKRQLLLRLNDQTTWLGRVEEIGRAKKALTLRCRVRQMPQDIVDAADARREGDEKIVPANLVREIVYLKTSTCPGCSEDFWFAPHESGDTCPHCGAFIENEHKIEEGVAVVCETCGAIRPCKCDIWAQTIQARAEERRKARGSWDCENQGHALAVGRFKCEFCDEAIAGIEWHGKALYTMNDEGVYLQAHVVTPASPVRTFTFKGQPWTVFDSLPDEQHLNTASPECKSWHRFPRGQVTECINCGLPEENVSPDWHWVSDGEYIKAVAPVVAGEQRGPLQ
jgi:hypothetical protein